MRLLVDESSGSAVAAILRNLGHDESSSNRSRVVQAVLQQCGEALPGRFVVATDTHIRVRPID